MHASIFQLSTKPISNEDWANKITFEEGVDDWCDYIGDVVTGDKRKSDIICLQNDLCDTFDCEVDGTLVYKGSLDEFRERWALAIRQTAAAISGANIFGLSRWRVENLMKRTHLEVDDMFYLEEWEGHAIPFSELLEFVACKLKKGDRLYIGAIYDFHY